MTLPQESRDVFVKVEKFELFGTAKSARGGYHAVPPPPVLIGLRYLTKDYLYHKI